MTTNHDDERGVAIPVEIRRERPLNFDGAQQLPAKGNDETLDRFWRAVRRLPKYARLAVNLTRDPQVPLRAKARLGFATAYLLSPIDLIPGVIPVAGQLDDLVVVLALLRSALMACPPEVTERHLERAGILASELDEDTQNARDAAEWLTARGKQIGKQVAREASAIARNLYREARTRATERRRTSAILG